MVRAFSAFDNKGMMPELNYLERIETFDGKILVDYSKAVPKAKQVISELDAAIMTQLMTYVVDGGTGGRLRSYFSDHAAGKTGTTNNNADGWFIGYTPSIVTGAWVGAEQPAVRWMSTGMGQGGVTALPICGKFLAKVYSDRNLKSYQKSNFPPMDSLVFDELFNCGWATMPDSLQSDSTQLEEMEEDSIQGETLRQMIQDAFKKKEVEDGRKIGFIKDKTINMSSPDTAILTLEKVK
jgi:penicillin-binding protein 1A